MIGLSTDSPTANGCDIAYDCDLCIKGSHHIPANAEIYARIDAEIDERSEVSE